MTAGRRILIVEDDALIAMLLEDMLSELDYHVAATAADVDTAMALAGDGAFDAAILDVSLAGKNSLPVARLLDETQKPYIFATGYGALPVGMEGSDRRVLSKPYQLDQLDEALTSLGIGS